MEKKTYTKIPRNDKQIQDMEEAMLSNSKQKQDDMLFNFIKKIVAGYYSVPHNFHVQKSRKRELVFARQVSMYLMYNNSKASYEKVGHFFGGKDHATVLHAVKTINGYIEVDSKIASQVKELQQVITFKAKALSEQINLEEHYYYIDLEKFKSIRFKYGRNMVLTGFSETEIELIKKTIGTVIDQREHLETGLYILEERENENEEGNDN
jgi:hypothetical protein